MGQPTWRLIKKVLVPEREPGMWTPALDYVSPGKLYCLTVELRAEAPAAAPDDADAAVNRAAPPNNVPAAANPAAPPNDAQSADNAAPPAPAPPRDQRWTPDAGQPCTADGDPGLERKDGALVLDTCAPGALIAKIGGSTAEIKPDKDKMTLFGVGRHCVFSIGDINKAGSLYLGINDTMRSIGRLQGQLEVMLFEAL